MNTNTTENRLFRQIEDLLVALMATAILAAPISAIVTIAFPGALVLA